MAVFYGFYLISFLIDFSFSHMRGGVLREKVEPSPIPRICSDFREPFIGRETIREPGSQLGLSARGTCDSDRKSPALELGMRG